MRFKGVEWLKELGFDGLYCCAGDPCGCEIDDIAPCGEGPSSECKPGYKLYHPTIKTFWAIWADKTPKTEEDWKRVTLEI